MPYIEKMERERKQISDCYTRINDLQEQQGRAVNDAVKMLIDKQRAQPGGEV
jgi:hypothetical protein